MLAVLVLASGVVLSIVFWEWLSEGESGSTTVRNIGLVLGGAVAILLAGWRGVVAEQSQFDERYQKSAEMLGSDLLSVRLGGIYALRRLAEDNPRQYHIQIMRLFCAFVRHPTGQERATDARDGAAPDSGDRAEEAVPLPSVGEDVKAIMTAIGFRGESRIRLEEDAGYRLDLRNSDLRGASLRGANLSHADLNRARLSRVDLGDANLSGATLVLADLSCLPSSKNDRDLGVKAASLGYHESRVTIMEKVDLSGANLFGTDLSNAVLRRANLSGAVLVAAVLKGSDISQAVFSKGGNPALGLAQANLNEACADVGDGPNLEGVVDDTTEKPLVWHDRPCQ